MLYVPVLGSSGHGKRVFWQRGGGGMAGTRDHVLFTCTLALMTAAPAVEAAIDVKLRFGVRAYL